jgi:hypothetical protein
VGTLLVLERAAKRRLARADPETLALRAAIQEDLDAGRISIGPAGRWIGAGLGTLGAIALVPALVLAAVVIRHWIVSPDRPLPASLAGGSAGQWALLLLVFVGIGALLLAEGVKLWRRSAPDRWTRGRGSA